MASACSTRRCGSRARAPTPSAGDASTSWRPACPRRRSTHSTQALGDWPDAIRLAARDWGVPLPPLTSQTYCPPALRIARRLEIRHDRLTAENLEALASCEHLSQLRALLLFDSGLDLAAIAALCRSPSLGALRTLTIGGNYVDDDGAKLIAEARAFPALEQLALPSNRLTSAAMRWLTESQRLAGLSALALPENEIGDDGLAVLGRSRLLGQLRSLDVTSNEVGPDGMISLCSGGALHRLEVAFLALNRCGDDGVAALASSAARLIEANLSENRITAAGVGSLIAGAAFAPISRLSLAYNQLGTEGAMTLGDDDVRQLLAADQLARLDTLDLRWNPISENVASARQRPRILVADPEP